VREKGLARAHVIGVVAPARMARQALSRQRMWLDKTDHVSAYVAPGRVAPPAWRICRAIRTGSTEANYRASRDDATKQAMTQK